MTDLIASADASAVAKLIESHAWLPLASMLIGLIVRLLKSDGPIPINVPAQYRAWLALGLGLVVGMLDMVIGGTAWSTALLVGLVSAMGAITAHETVVEGMKRGKEPFGNGPPASPRAPGAIALCFVILFAGASRGCLSTAEKLVVHDISQTIADLTAKVCHPADSEGTCLDKLAAHRASVKVQANADAAASVVGAVAK